MRRLTSVLTFALLTSVLVAGPARADAPTRATDDAAERSDETASRITVEALMLQRTYIPLPPAPVRDLISGVSSTHTAFGLRGGMRWDLAPSLLTGADFTLGVSHEFRGTAAAGEQYHRHHLIAGGFAGPMLRLGSARVAAVGVAEAGLHPGLRLETVAGQSKMTAVVVASTHAGPGLVFEAGWLNVRTQCLAGLWGFSPTTSCSAGAGVRF